jgi:hypothetical protein
MPLLYHTPRRGSSASSGFSDYSDHSNDTAPTVYSDREVKRQLAACDFKHEDEGVHDICSGRSSNASVETYASTTPSEADPTDGYPLYDEPEYQDEDFELAAIPSTPSEFAKYFPSSKKLCIRHDDSRDGNMNLRVDTEVKAPGRRLDLTLFHLRMYDLKSRDFSLRRHCRSSGREVCQSRRKYTKPAADGKSVLQRSMVNALASLKKSTGKNLSDTGSIPSLKRADSAYESMSDDEDIPETNQRLHSIPRPTNTTILDFSNYAHVDLKRRGTRSSKRYAFDYWGKSYEWRITVIRKDGSDEVSYHLYNSNSKVPIAHIIPTHLTPTEKWEEEQKGGWVPQCSMWINDEQTLKASADVAE